MVELPDTPEAVLELLRSLQRGGAKHGYDAVSKQGCICGWNHATGRMIMAKSHESLLI